MASPITTASPTVNEPEPTVLPTVEPSPTPTPAPTEEAAVVPWHPLSQFAAYGAKATVLVDRLRVRYGAGLALNPAISGNGSQFVLTKGDEVLLVGGPMEADGYRWYSVEFAWDDETTVASGWIAGARVAPGQTPGTDDWLISIGKNACPGQARFDDIRLMTDWAMDACRVDLTSIKGMVDSCYEGPITPWDGSPSWAWFTCLYIRDATRDQASGSKWFPIYFPPDIETVDLERGDVVVLSGALGVDTARYGACTVEAYSPDEPSLQLMEPTIQFSFAESCRHKFVVSGATIKRHIELEPQF